jgi:5,5'-dehydrodivanillate O-demethylase
MNATVKLASDNLTDTEYDYVHTGPGTLAGRYLRQFWQPVFVGKKLEPGWSKPITIMSEKLALYRSQEGDVHCVENRCAHRGALLSTGWVEGDNIRCPYHGWAYGPDGQCAHQPLERAGFCKNIKIKAYPAREYLGMIWLYMGEGEPPELPRYKEWEDAPFIAPLIDTRACNYFQNLENLVDEGHIWYTHTNSALANLDLNNLPKLSVEKTPWGISNVAERNGVRRVVQLGMPNAGMFAVHPANINRPGEKPPEFEVKWQNFLDFRVPIDDYNHLQVHMIAVHIEGTPDEAYLKRWEEFDKAEAQGHEVAAKVMRGELQYDDIARLCHHTPLAQDEVCQVGQGAIADRTRGVENLGASDVAIVQLRKIWTEELRRFAAGEPLTPYHRPEGLLPVAGDH